MADIIDLSLIAESRKHLTRLLDARGVERVATRRELACDAEQRRTLGDEDLGEDMLDLQL